MSSTRDIEADIAVAAEGAVADVAGSIGMNDATLPCRKDTEKANAEAHLQAASLPLGDTATFTHESPTVFCEPEVKPSIADASTAETSPTPTEAVLVDDPGEQGSCRVVCARCEKVMSFAIIMFGVGFAVSFVCSWLFVLGALAFSFPITFAAIVLAIALAILGCKCWDRYGKKDKDDAMASNQDPEADIIVADIGGSIGNDDVALPSGNDPKEADIAVAAEGDSIGKDNARSPSGQDLEEADIGVAKGESIGKDNLTSHPEEHSTKNKK
jgi:hypothetical protein